MHSWRDTAANCTPRREIEESEAGRAGSSATAAFCTHPFSCDIIPEPFVDMPSNSTQKTYQTLSRTHGFGTKRAVNWQIQLPAEVPRNIKRDGTGDGRNYKVKMDRSGIYGGCVVRDCGQSSLPIFPRQRSQLIRKIRFRFTAYHCGTIYCEIYFHVYE